METRFSDLKERGQTLFSDPTSRMHSRPLPTPAKGTAFEDLGTTQFRTSSKTKARGATSATKLKRNGRVVFSEEDEDEDESDDEMDVLSSQHDSSPPQPVVRKGKSTARDGAVVKGSFHEYHDRYRPREKDFPNFTKNKSKSKGSTVSADSDTQRVENAPNHTRSPSPRSATITLKPSRLPAPIRTYGKSSHGKIQRGGVPLDVRNYNQVDEEERPKPGPKPRPVGRSKQPQEFPMSLTPPRPQRTTAGKAESDKNRTGRERSQENSLKQASSLTQAHGTPSRSSERAEEFPAMSPLGSPPRSKNYDPFANLSPLPPEERRNKNKDRSKGKASHSRCPSNDSDAVDEDELRITPEDELNTYGGPRPFPMSTQMLESIRSVPELDEGVVRSMKRLSSGSGGDDDCVKKQRTGDMGMDSIDIDNSHLDGDSMFIDPSIDPTTLCPYCDEPLPDTPSPHLTDLLTTTKRRSYTDKRPSNPLGLKAPLPVFIAVCQRHRFETHQIPLARARGWPTNIDWARLRLRVERMKDWLEELIRDECIYMEEENGSGGEESPEERRKSPKERSIFWKEIMKAIKKTGTRAVVGVRGQFTSFEKTQPGYYGELGAVIIHQTLYTLFPPHTLPSHAIAPLSANEFIQRVLVPEVALALVMEDTGAGRRRALETLRESVQYGVAMFPDAGGEDEDEGEGEQIVRERARRRRKELEEEERLEAEMWAREEAESAKKSAKPRVKPRAIVKAKKVIMPVEESDVELLSEASHRGQQTTTHAKKMVREKSADVEILSDASVRSTRSTRSTRSSTRASEQAKATSSVSGTVHEPHSRAKRSSQKNENTRSESEDVEICAITPHAKPRPKPRSQNTPITVLDWSNEEEATPRPRGGNAIAGQSSKPLAPLLQVRQRQARTRSAQRSEWTHNLLDTITT